MTNRPAAVHSNTKEPGGSASNDLNESETSPELQKKSYSDVLMDILMVCTTLIQKGQKTGMASYG